MIHVAEPIQPLDPHPDCPRCHGEGRYTPESMMFDYDNRPPCSYCLVVYQMEDEEISDSEISD